MRWHLLALNHAVAKQETGGEPVTGPGLPPCVTDATALITQDCVRVRIREEGASAQRLSGLPHRL
jgi:hypothetical protein